jgi:hypothetical protein
VVKHLRGRYSMGELSSHSILLNKSISRSKLSGVVCSVLSLHRRPRPAFFLSLLSKGKFYASLVAEDNDDDDLQDVTMMAATLYMFILSYLQGLKCYTLFHPFLFINCDGSSIIVTSLLFEEMKGTGRVIN